MLNVTRTVELPSLRFPTVEVFLRYEEGEIRFGIRTFTKDEAEFEISLNADTWEGTNEEFLEAANEFFDTCPWDEGLEAAVHDIQTRTAEEAMEYCTK